LVQGAVEDGLTVYRGIPFAAPPVGDLRWRAPQSVVKWDGAKEVAYVFQHLNPNQKPAKSDEAISEAMATYWTNFAKFGDPNGAGLPKWPAFSDSTPVLMYFAETPHTGPVPSADALKVMDQYFA
jgi:carboxylesterase type B